jgi:DNA-binding MarR family transcriptional regulator/GNAT superfamily N-acetyltransferase|tara:strand:+ start:315 stop:1283 length:969 start_codon:yes stop_codon:yes gene_type:complete
MVALRLSMAKKGPSNMADQTTGHHSAFLERVQQAQGHYNEQAGLDKSLDAPRIRLGLLLYNSGPASIVALSERLRISHPAVVQIARALIQDEYLADYRDRRDKRRRLLALTNSGRYYFSGISAHSELKEQLLSTLANAVGLPEVLARWSQALAEQSLSQRFDAVISGITITPYRAEFKTSFELLNRRWIEASFQVEDRDQAVFDDPEAKIITPGGAIFFAVTGRGHVVGACALLRQNARRAELAKMAVQEQFQQFGIGRRLGQAVIDFAEAAGFDDIVLESNRRLKPALSLYRALGFIEGPAPATSDYDRADIFMSKPLGPG